MFYEATAILSIAYSSDSTFEGSFTLSATFIGRAKSSLVSLLEIEVKSSEYSIVLGGHNLITFIILR